METFETTQFGNKTIRISQYSCGIYRATITLASDISEFGNLWASKELKTLAGIRRWIKKELTAPELA